MERDGDKWPTHHEVRQMAAADLEGVDLFWPVPEKDSASADVEENYDESESSYDDEAEEEEPEPEAEPEEDAETAPLR